jgi:plastocyanin
MSKFLLLICCIISLQSVAGELHINITDAQQKSLPFNVIELINNEYPARPIPEGAQVIQQGLHFQPFVSVVPQGTLIEFPNLDKTRHHVYSFSPAKVFELRLYAGKPEAPVMFDQAGVVTLGCNIHDNMLAYIYVSSSQFTAVTDASGQAYFNNLPEADFKIRMWHPWQREPLPSETIGISTEAQHIAIELDVIQQKMPGTPKADFNDY